MADYTLNVAMSVDLGDFDTKFARAAARVRAFGSDVADFGGRALTAAKGIGPAFTAMGDEVAKSAGRHKEAWTTAGQSVTAFGAVAAAGLGFAAKAAIDWESAWAGVVKTTDASAAELPALEEALRGMTAYLPATHGEIAAVAEAAGQLGIKSKDVVGFTRVMIDLGESTNLSADEAATALAQMMNIMGTAPEDVGRLGAALVHLGNNGAATERDITEMALRIAGAGSVIGLQEHEVLGFANALASVGIEAEAGGSAISRAMITMADSVRHGGSELESFASVAGMSGQDFATAFQDKPAQAMAAFIGGLGRMQASGQDVFGTLDDLGLGEIRVRDAMLRLSGASDMVNQSLEDGAQSWRDNTALVAEAAKRYETTESRIAIARNQLAELGIELGSVLLPALAELANNGAAAFGWLADLPDPAKDAAVLLGGVTASVGLLGGGLLLLLPRIIETRAALATMATDAPRTAAALGTMARAAGVAGAALAIGALVIHLSDLVDTQDPVAMSVEKTTAALLAMEDAADASNIVKFTQQIGDAGKATANIVPGMNRGKEAIYDINDALSDLTGEGVMSKANRFGQTLDKMFGVNIMANQNAAAEQFANTGRALASLVEGGNLGLAKDRFDLLYESVDHTKYSQEDLMRLMPDYEAALTNVDNAVTGAAGSSEQLAASMDQQAAAAGMTTEAWDDAAKSVKDMRDAWDEAARSFLDINGTYVSMLDTQRAEQEKTAHDTADKKGLEGDAWEQFVGEVKIALDDYLAELQRQEQAQDAWQGNMLSLVGKVSQGTIDYLARLGPEGAPLVQALVDGTDAQLHEFDRLTNETMAGATGGWIQEMEQAGPLIEAVAGRLGRNAADELAAKIRTGQVTVGQAAASLGAQIKENVPGQWTVTFGTVGVDATIIAASRVRAALMQVPTQATWHAPMVPVGNATGNVLVKGMAAGGVLTPMSPVASIVPPGTLRVIGDNMRVDESYIPHDDSPRSHTILDQTATTMGYYLLPRNAPQVRHYAQGEFISRQAAATTAAATAEVDPLDGREVTLLVDGEPVRAIFQTGMRAEARRVASGRRR